MRESQTLKAPKVGKDDAQPVKSSGWPSRGPSQQNERKPRQNKRTADEVAVEKERKRGFVGLMLEKPRKPSEFTGDPKKNKQKKKWVNNKNPYVLVSCCCLNLNSAVNSWTFVSRLTSLALLLRDLAIAWANVPGKGMPTPHALLVIHQSLTHHSFAPPQACSAEAWCRLDTQQHTEEPSWQAKGAECRGRG